MYIYIYTNICNIDKNIRIRIMTRHYPILYVGQSYQDSGRIHCSNGLAVALDWKVNKRQLAAIIPKVKNWDSAVVVCVAICVSKHVGSMPGI